MNKGEKLKKQIREDGMVVVMNHLSQSSYDYCFITVDTPVSKIRAVISTVVEPDGTIVIVGMENIDARPEKTILDHLDALRQKLPMLKTTTFVVAIDSGFECQCMHIYGQISSHIKKQQNKHKGRIVIMWEGTSYGIRFNRACREYGEVYTNKPLCFLRNLVTVLSIDLKSQTISADLTQQQQEYKQSKLQNRTPPIPDLLAMFMLNIWARAIFICEPSKYL